MLTLEKNRVKKNLVRENRVKRTCHVQLRMEKMDMHLCPNLRQFYRQVANHLMGASTDISLISDFHTCFLFYRGPRVILMLSESQPESSTFSCPTNFTRYDSIIADMCESLPLEDFLTPISVEDIAQKTITGQLFRGGMRAILVQITDKCNVFSFILFSKIMSSFHWRGWHIQYQKQLLLFFQKYMIHELAEITMSYQYA